VGGPTLIRGLWQRRVIDELGFLIVPLLFGQGSALFPLTDAPAQQRLELVEQHAYPDGALAVRYAPAPDSR